MTRKTDPSWLFVTTEGTRDDMGFLPGATRLADDGPKLVERSKSSGDEKASIWLFSSTPELVMSILPKLVSHVKQSRIRYINGRTDSFEQRFSINSKKMYSYQLAHLCPITNTAPRHLHPLRYFRVAPFLRNRNQTGIHLRRRIILPKSFCCSLLFLHPTKKYL